MYGVKTRFDSLPAVVAFVSALLLGLGFLQYRWTGELSEAERARMRASLRERASQMARDLDREVTRAFLWLQVDATAMESGGDGRFAERYDRWRERSALPGIVTAVYFARAEGGLESDAPLRYSPERRTFEPAKWPTAIATARDLARAEGGGGRLPRGGWFGPLDLLPDGTPIGLMPGPRFGGGPSAAEAPGFGVDPRRPSRRVPAPPSFGLVRLIGVSVIVFDRDAIASGLLPRLARRHFPEGTDPGFDLRVLRRDRPKEVIYQSAAGDVRGAEASVGLLELRFEDASEEDLRAHGGPFVARTDTRRVMPERRGFPGRMMRGRGRGEDAGLWVLQVAYRDGSVEALVAAARRRNLAVSFSVLLLLGAATVLLASAARRARRLSERQMEFVATVSHELRTPVSVICSAGENLADGVVSDREGVVRYGALVRDEGRRLARLLEQVLDFAGSYTGRRSYRREPVAVEQVIGEALAAADPALREAGFRAERETAPGLPFVLGDAPALARAVRNLVENAVKYGGDDHTVTVRARVAEGARAVRIEVEDKGLGIPAEEQRHLFEPFWRGAHATSRQIRGSGLGLALVESIARAHGGRVSVRSQPGQGSVFTLELPAAGPTEAGTVTAGAGASQTSGARDEKGHDDIAHPAG